jgi:THO complex subunit 3
MLATITEKKMMYFFDVRSGKQTHSVKTEGSNINMAWSPDGRYVAVGNKSDTILFVDAKNGNIVKRQKFSYEINQIKWNTASQFLMATNQSRSRGVVQVMKLDVATSPSSSAGDHDKASSSSSSENALTLRPIHQMLGHTSNCFSIELDPTGKYIASGSSDAMVCIWNTSDFTCSSAISRMEWPVQSLSFSYDGTLLASGSEDTFIDIADTQTGARIWKQETKGMTYSLAWHPKAFLLAYTHDAPTTAGGDANTIKLIGI